MPPSAQLKIRRVKIKALNDRFIIDGKQAQPGQETTVDYSDAFFLVEAGKAEIVAEAEPRTIVIEDPPRWRVAP